MQNRQCLNCESTMTDNFCSDCGQKTDTHRITLGHFIMHDMLHGVWHLEKGILFTLKEVFVRPGKAALDYIHGKRIRYYNVFYLSLLLIGLNLLLSHFYDGFRAEKTQSIKETVAVKVFFEQYLKLILLGIVPILAANARLVFRKSKLNLAEHFIIGGFTLVGMLVASIVFFFMNFLNAIGAPDIFGIFEIISFFLIPLFPLWSYANGFWQHYSIMDFAWRIVTFYFLVAIELSLILLGIVYLLTGGTDLTLNI